MSSLAQLSGSYDGVAKAAMTAAQAQRLSALISDAAGKDKTATENVMKGLDTKLKLIQTTKASISAGNFGKVAGKSSSSSKGSGSGKSAPDTAKEEIEAYMEYLEKALEGGRITYSDYVRDVTLKLDDMYHNGRITAKEYFDYVEKRLNQQLEVYKSVLSAVTDLLEDEAQKWQDKIDALNDENDLLEKQKDDYDSILSAVDQVYQNEIDRLNEQKDLLQDKIDAINDENDALELQRKKQEALIALDKARQQRNVKIYTEDRGYFYDIDQDAYKDAQQNLQDIKNEEVIKKLEDEQDALDDSIELLEKYRDLWNDIADAYYLSTGDKYVEPTPENPEPTEPIIETLENIKTNKISELNTICNKMITSGVDVEIDGKTEHFSYTIEDQANIDDIAQMAKSTNMEQSYHCDNGSCKLYTVEEITKIYMTQKMNKAHNITYANQLKLYVKSLKEKAEVESIAYGQDLTGEYLNTYNTIMEHEQSVAKAFIATE